MKTVRIKDVSVGQGQPKIAVPITGATQFEILQQAKKIVKYQPDLVEWRIDFFQKVTDKQQLISTAKVLKECLAGLALLITFRTAAEGGQLKLPVEKYYEIVQTIIEQRLSDAIDLEFYRNPAQITRLISLAKKEELTVIVSYHNFQNTPIKEEILKHFTAMSQSGADIAKIAVMPQTKADVVNLLTATSQSTAVLDLPLIAISMGSLGKISRVAGEVFGSAMTFASVEAESAPGQISINTLRKMLKELRIE
jgi:3-dehydroquinate dehydratase-1